MTELRTDLPPLPTRMRDLPVDARGYPVPWFVAFIDGVPDFRVVDTPKWPKAIRSNICWLCGQPKGNFHAFVIGPMCVINRTTSEPSCHRECAMFAVRACPFMLRPRMKRNAHEMPKGIIPPPGDHLERNPGAFCVYVTRSFSIFRASDGDLIRLSEPEYVLWFAEGREATRAEVQASINSGLPFLREVAEVDGPEAVKELEMMIAFAQPLLPA